MEYSVVETDEVAVTDLSQIEEIPPDLDMQDVDSALGLENMLCKIWHFEEDEQIGYHAHAQQEELFYVLEGRFSLKLGRSGEEEFREVGPGTFWAAGPMIGHGHRCVSESGKVLALGAPDTADPGLDPHQISDEEIEEAQSGDD
ncbi:cupin domain-containing protein [Haloglomus salinum]|jgi:quercetin dioxygenase-like cupin family protein|uniref:cupin domain-containing protein n=1 Tax=Haloglomus salinum TaxID=2962673 RepID=UPI0020CA168D|nr:cupin domain-containing protein [Haloglomus salinum]